MAKDFFTTIFASGGLAGEHFDVAAGPTNTGVIDTLLSIGDGTLTEEAPLTIKSTGALGAARTLDITRLESADGRIFFLSVRNSDILINNLTISSTVSINDIGPTDSFIIDQESDWIFVHETGGVWRAYAQGSTGEFSFGDNFNSNEETTFLISTIANLFLTHNTLSVSNIPAGIYMVSWFYVWSHNSGGNDFLGRVNVESSLGTVELIDPGGTEIHRQEPKDSAGPGPGGTNQRHVASGFNFVTLPAIGTSDSADIRVQFATDTNATESTVYHSVIAMWRVDTI